MKKLIQPKDLLMLGLAGAIDIFEEFRDPFGLRAEGCQAIYGFTPERFKKHNFYDLVWRNLRTEDIEKIEKNGQIYLRITTRGQERIKRDFPLLSLSDKRWDRKWRVVIFDIEEATRLARDQLRDKLKELGFGMMQKSVWLTPHDVLTDFSEFLESSGLSAKVIVMETKIHGVYDEKEMANRIWKLKSLNDDYKNILEDLMKSYDRSKLSNDLKKYRERYLEVFKNDPFLPKELLPGDWIRDKLWKLLKKA